MRFSSAVCVSAAFHAALAAGLCAWLARRAPDDDALGPSLDVASVEVSFAEDEREEAPAAVMPPAQEPPPPRPEAAEPPPDAYNPLPVLPPDPDALALPEPEPEPPPKMDAPPQRERQPAPEAAPEPQPQAPSAAPRQAKVDAPPRPKRTIRPDYPRGSRLRGEQGRVVLRLTVDERGNVADVAVAESSGFPELDAAAERAARAARFVPARADGASVSATALLTLDFRLK